jgi:hypothetical protein
MKAISLRQTHAVVGASDAATRGYRLHAGLQDRCNDPAQQEKQYRAGSHPSHQCGYCSTSAGGTGAKKA